MPTVGLVLLTVGRDDIVYLVVGVQIVGFAQFAYVYGYDVGRGGVRAVLRCRGVFVA